MKSIGQYRYKSGWLVIDVDESIGSYYRHLFYLGNHKCRRLRKPTWGAHISVVYNYIDTPYVDASQYDGMEIEFEYGIEMNDNGVHCWLPVDCPHALEIRQSLGLGPPIYLLHLTIGNLKDG